MRIALGLALLLSACVSTDSPSCGGELVCRSGTVCHDVAFDGATATECVTTDQLAKCVGMPDGKECDGGTCFSEACLPPVCGNRRVDFNETCDDGNDALGDGCSPACQSEVCGNGLLDPLKTENGESVINERCDDGNSLSHDGCASTCELEVLHWRKIPANPRQRAYAGMAVDYDGRRAFMFGGLDNTDLPDAQSNDDELEGLTLGDTWELSATGWQLIDAVPSPSPRAAVAMAQDGDSTFLFGGTDSLAKARGLGDFWVLHDRKWKQLADPAGTIGARVGASLEFWPGHGLVLFGGQQDTTVFGDTYIYDGTSWSAFSPTTSEVVPGRAFATLTYDVVRKRLILAGGRDLQTMTPMDSYGLDDTGWHVLHGANQPNVYAATAAFDRALQKVVVYGGAEIGGGFYVSGTRGLVWEFDGTDWSKRSVAGPTARTGATGGVEPISGHLQMFGGRDLGFCTTSMIGGTSCTVPTALTFEDDVYLLDAGPGDAFAWTRRSIVPPPALSQTAFAYDVDHARLIIFGGRRSSGDDTPVSNTGINDTTWEVSGHTWTDHTPMLRPTPRIDASMAYATIGQESGALMCGGNDAATTFSDCWMYVDGAWAKKTAYPLPVPIRGAAMAFDPVAKKVLLFGGVQSGVVSNQAYVLDEAGWHLLPDPPDGLAPRYDAAMAYDPLHRTMVMFGGRTDSAPPVLDDVWQIELSAANPQWTSPTVTLKPVARAEARLAWDAPRRRMLMWGGHADSSVWQWDGTQWTFLQALESPVARDSAVFSMTTDNAILMHGGTTSQNSVGAELFELVREGTSLDLNETACVSQTDDDGDGKTGCADADCWTVCTPWCPPGREGEEIACDASKPACGDSVCQSPRENCGNCPSDCHEGCY